MGREHQASAGDYAPFTEGALDAEQVLVTTIRKTLDDVVTVEAEVESARAAGNVADATRAMAIALRTKHLLVRELKAYTGSAGSTQLRADLATVQTVFDGLLDKPIDDQALLEVTTRALLQKLRAVEAQYLAAAKRNPELGERALSIFLKTHTALEGTLQRLHGLRQEGNGDTNLASAPAGAGGPGEPLPTAFDGLLEGQVNAHAVSQAVVRAIAEKMKRVEQEYQTAVLAGRSDADQALTKFLKVLPLLQRALERFKDTGKPQEEAKKTLLAAVKELTEVAFSAVDTFVKDHTETMHKFIEQYSQNKLTSKLLQRYLDDYSTQWRQTLGLTLYQDLRAAYEKSELWRRLRNYPQQPVGGQANPSCSKEKPSDTTDEGAGEQSRSGRVDEGAGVRAGDEHNPDVTGPSAGEREEGKVVNERLAVAIGRQAASYSATTLVEALRGHEIEPMEALRALRECAASFTMDELSRMVIEARPFPEFQQEAIRLLAQREEQRG